MTTDLAHLDQRFASWMITVSDEVTLAKKLSAVPVYKLNKSDGDVVFAAHFNYEPSAKKIEKMLKDIEPTIGDLPFFVFLKKMGRYAQTSTNFPDNVHMISINKLNFNVYEHALGKFITSKLNNNDPFLDGIRAVEVPVTDKSILWIAGIPGHRYVINFNQMGIPPILLDVKK